MSSFDAEAFLTYQISNAQVRRYPFPHFYVAPAFPEEFYAALLAAAPPTASLKRIDEYGTVKAMDDGAPLVEANRFIADLATLEEDEERRGAGSFWAELSAWLMGDDFRNLLIQKFARDIRERFGEGARLATDIDARFVRDFTRYALAPHTDTPAKLVSLLFYLPGDDSLRRHGTTLYAPIDPNLRCDGTTRHAVQRFRKVATMPFVPNALFGFLKSDRSFHGVEAIEDAGVERNLILYNIYAKNLAAEKAAPQEKRAFWSRGARG